MTDISIARLHELFELKEDGTLIRRSDIQATKYKKGDKAGGIGAHGRMKVRISGNTIYFHRIVWAMTYGFWPQVKIDHINNNPLDNRPSNLRLASDYHNVFNSVVRKDSTSGLKGVSFDRQSNSWRVQVSAFKRRRCLNGFLTKELAYDFACLLRFHLHGEFAHD